MEKPPTGIDDKALDFAGAMVSEAQFDKCVVRTIRDLGLSSRGAAATSGLNDSYIRRVQNGTKRIGLFSLFKLASAAELTASQIVEKIENELRAEVSK